MNDLPHFVSVILIQVLYTYTVIGSDVYKL